MRPIFLVSPRLLVVAILCTALSAPSFCQSAVDVQPTIVPTTAPQMKTIGVIGGITWVSSIEYYRLMNQMVQKKLGGVSSAKVLMYSIEFGEFSKEERLADQGNWGPLRKIMLNASERLKKGGADFIVIASNTMNSTAGLIEEKVHIPVLSIVDATGQKVRLSGIQKVVLLGTKYTMENGFYKKILEQKYGLTVVTPNLQDRDYINAVIFDELAAEKFTPEAKARFIQISERLVKESGAQGVILGCTEIPLLIQQQDISVPVFDTTAIHVEAAVKYALGEK